MELKGIVVSPSKKADFIHKMQLFSGPSGAELLNIPVQLFFFKLCQLRMYLRDVGKSLSHLLFFILGIICLC